VKADEVPQDVARAYLGMGKALYAVDSEGSYTLVRSAGWEAEEIVLDQAIAECERMAREAHERGLRGEASPLEYHMYKCRMDVVVLSQSTGYFRWRVRRHFRPTVFARLSDAIRQRYADALGMRVEELVRLPADP